MQIIASFYLIVISTLITFLIYVIVAQVIVSWLIAFDIVNARNRFVGMIWNFTQSLTRPVLRPLQSVIPSIGGVDIAPLILILLLLFIDNQLSSFFLQYVR